MKKGKSAAPQTIGATDDGCRVFRGENPASPTVSCNHDILKGNATLHSVGGHLKATPAKYRKTPQVVDIHPDENGEALVYLRNTKFLIRVHAEPAKPAEPVGILDTIRGFFR